MRTDAGAKLVACADGTSFTVSDGEPGKSCTVVGGADGGTTISCADGTTVTIPPPPPPVVVDGGTTATSCTITTGDGGVRMVICSDGTSVIVPDPTQPPATTVDPSADLPGVVIKVVSLSGGSGDNGNFQIGDTVSARFTVKTKAGVDLPLGALDAATIWIAGPTSSYQHLLPPVRDQTSYSDVRTAATRNSDGSYTYKFSAAIPATYGPPLYDTTKFSDGELTGQPLQHGTYTLALRAYKSYTVSGTSIRDVGSVTQDFLLGSATTIEPREVVTIANCNNCHVQVQAHGGTYRDVKLCVTCHTAGAEDRNSTDTNDATPITIDFRSMIHKIHNGEHLPSVLGVSVGADGSRVYGGTPVDFKVSSASFSDVAFPVWPNLNIPMPRPRGYSTLTATQQATSDLLREGVTACSSCHGDPDGAGPLAAPAQGDFAYTHSSRLACGSCHDDIDWSKPFKKNTDSGMPAQADDAMCVTCHPATGVAVGGSPRDGHRHPLADSTFNPGLNIAISKVAEAGTANNDGTVDPGEKIAVTFTMTDDTGAAAPANAVTSLSLIVTGPTSNRNILLNTSISTTALTGSQPWTVNLPEPVILERVGTSSATTGDAFVTARTPHWNLAAAPTSVFVRTATGTATTLASAGAATQNFVDVASATGFARNDYIVVDDAVAGKEEYLRIQFVDGNRLWFGSSGAAYQPGLRVAHAAGAGVAKVTLATKTVTTDYTLAAATGTITEVTEFGTGAVVLASYTSDFIVPAVYGPAINESPDLGENVGKWRGLPLVDGTYTVGLWGARALTLTKNGETNSYRGTSPTAMADFLVGSATKITPVSIISSGANCNSCHVEVYGHGGGRRGGDGCLLCHGNAGSEDRPRYVAANAPATPRFDIEFRSMLHKIHMGKDLAKAASFNVVGFGAGAYPNNFSVLSFGDVEFPAMPSGVKDCHTCHGSSTAWQAPVDRSHPTAATAPAQSWQLACGSCHDSDAASAHFDAMTGAGGKESCAVCHEPGRDQGTILAHKIR